MTANSDDLDRRDALKLIAGGLGLAAVLVACAARGAAARAIPQDPPARDLQAVPSELYLADSSLHIINVYKIEAAVLRDSQGRSQAEILDRLAREVYAPYSTFWRGYLGDEATFRKWAESSLLARSHPIHTRVAALVRLNLDSLFTAGAAWVSHNTGHRPHGTWYIVFGPGWTDMGGFADGTMLADFTKMEPERDALEFKFPHEFTHMAGASAAARRDADSGTVLAGIISEGVASYATYVYAAGRLARAQSIGYTEPEWTWALAHERDLIAAAKPYLGSRVKADDDRLRARNQRLLVGGPTAVAYFLGFRIIEAYAAHHGAASWIDAMDLPAREVLARSGYQF